MKYITVMSFISLNVSSQFKVVLYQGNLVTSVQVKVISGWVANYLRTTIITSGSRLLVFRKQFLLNRIGDCFYNTNITTTAVEGSYILPMMLIGASFIYK